MKVISQKIIQYHLFVCILLMGTTGSAQLQKLRIADNNRFIVKEDGSPFIWIGETNWFFARLPSTTIDSILDKRSKQGFTVMFVSCREKLYHGDGPGKINDPNENWWSYLDDYIHKCAQRNLYVGITLGWWGLTKRYNESELYEYGKWVGNRYRDHNNIIWLTLGEAGSQNRKEIIPETKLAALVKGIRDGDTGEKLLTVHADFKRGTSISKVAELCDFNNWQTSQWCCPDDLPRKDERNWTVWEAIQFDYNQLYNGKPKPTLDSEAWYENNKDFCNAGDFNIRRRAYFTIFAGAFGHTYGAGGIWDGLNTLKECSKSALKAIHYSGARQMGYLSHFLQDLNYDFLKLRPNQSLIIAGNSENYDKHIQAAFANDSSFALIYSASDAGYTVDITRLSNLCATSVWFNPRNNQYQIHENQGLSQGVIHQFFDPPGEFGPGNDWVLILGNETIINKYKMN